MALPRMFAKFAEKANVSSPIFIGVPQAPTALAGTNTSQLATTEYVVTAVANKIDITGNAGTATKLATARTISLDGDVTGSITFDGTQNVSLTCAVTNDSHTHTIETITSLQTTLDAKAPLESPEFTGTPLAPTQSQSDNTTKIATTAYVHSAVNAVAATVAQAMIFKGTLGLGGTVETLPTEGYTTGWTYQVIIPEIYAGQICEVGDAVVCVHSFDTVYSDDDWMVVQGNTDGVVIGPTAAVDSHVAIFDGATGKIIKDTGLTLGTSVPANAVFTDTVYTHPTTGVTEGTYKSVTVNAQGHVTSGTNPTTLSGYGITDAAPKASPTLTGTPLAPTATAGTNTTQIATTAFVTTAVSNKTSVTGNAGTATKLATARTISLSGDATGSASFDGSQDTSLTVTVNNATTADTFTTARNIDGMSFNGSASIGHFGICTTAAATVAKTLSKTGFSLEVGARVTVQFTITNTATAPTLNVNATGAKPIYYRGAVIPTTYLPAGCVYDLVYTGTAYEIVGQIGLDAAFV